MEIKDTTNLTALVSDYAFRDYLARLLDDYTKDNYFGFDEQGRKVEWKI